MKVKAKMAAAFRERENRQAMVGAGVGLATPAIIGVIDAKTDLDLGKFSIDDVVGGLGGVAVFFAPRRHKFAAVVVMVAGLAPRLRKMGVDAVTA